MKHRNEDVDAKLSRLSAETATLDAPDEAVDRLMRAIHSAQRAADGSGELLGMGRRVLLSAVVAAAACFVIWVRGQARLDDQVFTSLELTDTTVEWIGEEE